MQELVTRFPQEARSYEPSWREYLANALMGDKASQPRRDFVSGLMGSTGLGSTGMGLADVTPLGALMGVQEAYRRGDPQGMALAGVIPFGGAGRGTSKMAKTILGDVRPNLGATVSHIPQRQGDTYFTENMFKKHEPEYTKAEVQTLNDAANEISRAIGPIEDDYLRKEHQQVLMEAIHNSFYSGISREDIVSEVTRRMGLVRKGTP